ncbi:MAG: hypothetical protein FWH26_10695 [Oscillospiraceae bacterium]|nr:hypothetical protein [Oscillospiraceae bacterium]
MRKREPGKPSRYRQNKATRAWARQLMRGQYAPAAGLLLLGFAVMCAMGFLPLLLDFAADTAVAALPQTPAAEMGLRWGRAAGAALLALLALLPCSALRMGREAWFFGAAEGRKRSRSRVLFWLQPRWAFKAARFLLAVALRKLLWAAVYLLPGAFLLVGTLLQARGGELNLALFLSAVIGGGALLLLGLCFYIATAQRYALVPAILSKQPRSKLKNVLRLSAARTEGHCGELFRFHCGFLPLLLLCLLVVPAFPALPYIHQSRACRHAELLTGRI